jgi:molecular chaperone GrpE
MSSKSKEHSAADEILTSVAEEEVPLESQTPDEEQVSELDQLRADFAALEGRYLRQAADFQNFRRRAMEDRAYSLDIGRNQIALPALDILDDLRRSIEAADESVEAGEAKAFEALHSGVRLVYEKFVTELDKIGIRPMVSVGEPFDEDRHEAMMQQPAPEGTEPGIVLGEIQKGYTIGDRVLRHARVIVAS